MKPKTIATAIASVFLLVISLSLVGSAAKLEPKETLLYVFPVYAAYASPTAGVIFDKAGNLYSTTQSGGDETCSVAYYTGCGTVFELSPPSQPGGSWTSTVLYSFQGGIDGAVPYATPVMDASGNLYGTTAYGGGSQNCGTNYGCGTVFELSPPSQPGGPWTETILYSFQGGSDAAQPQANLILDAEGNLYGASAYGGGAPHCGPSGC